MSGSHEVSLSAIDIRTIPLNWTAVAKLGKSINELKDEPLRIQEFGPLNSLTELLYPAIPMVASIIANRRNPEIPIMYPTDEQVKAMKPGWGLVSDVIGRFSANWQARFNRILERKGSNRVTELAEQAFGIINVLEATHYVQPQKSFIDGLGTMYKDLSQPEMQPGGLFGWDQIEKPIEDKIKQLISEIRNARFGHSSGRYFDSSRHPFLAKLLVNANAVGINFPSEPTPSLIGPNSDEKTAIAGSEVMGGIETFLKRNNRNDIPNAPRPMEFDFFNPDSYMRTLAEWYSADKLERVKVKLPEVLGYVVDCIPEDPTAVSIRIYEIAEGIVNLKKQGRSDKEIAEALINNWKKGQIDARFRN